MTVHGDMPKAASEALTFLGARRLYAPMETKQRRPRRLRPEVAEIRRRVSQALSRFRATHRAQQSEIAQVLGVSQSTVARWEAGKAEPRGPLLAELAHHMGLPVESLIGVGAKAMRPGQPLSFEGWIGDPGFAVAPMEPMVLPAWFEMQKWRDVGFFIAGHDADHATPGEVLVVRGAVEDDLRDPSAAMVIERRIDGGDLEHHEARIVLCDRSEGREYLAGLPRKGPTSEKWRLTHRIVWRFTPLLPAPWIKAESA